MEREKHPWAQALRDALRKWGDQNGYRYISMLGQELGIPEGPWTRISAAHNIVEEAEYYARLFARTGLQEADPRHIPLRGRGTKGGKFEYPRAWTEIRWQEWFQTEGRKYQKDGTKTPETVAPPPSEVRAPEPSPPPQNEVKIPESLPPPQTVGALVDGWISQLAIQIAGQLPQPPTAEEIAARLAHKLTPLSQVDSKASKPEKDNLGSLIRKTISILEQAKEGTKEDRDALVAEFGPEIGQLYGLLDPFTERPDKREQSLQRVGGITL